MFVVVTYDVNEKRVQRVEAYLQKFLFHAQNSVFEGDLGKNEIKELEKGLQKIISSNEDSVRIYIFESRDAVKIKSMGAQANESNVI